jgi:mannose-1-phosphate guanylyltransferase
VLQYREKPETFISSTINCGVYLLNGAIFNLIKEILMDNQVCDGWIP